MGHTYGGSTGATYGSSSGGTYGGSATSSGTDPNDLPRMKNQHWYVEIVRSDGTTLRPTIIRKPIRRPTVNGLPRIEIPVRRDDKWSDPSFEDQTMNVWYKGQRQPIEELRKVSQEPGATVLIGIGGLELEQRVTAEYESKEVYQAATDLLSTYTNYTPNVDTPPQQIEENEVLRETNTTGDWFGTYDYIGEKPVFIENGRLETQRSCWMDTTGIATGIRAFEGAMGDSSTKFTSGGTDYWECGFWGGDFAEVGDEYEVTFTPNYYIPEGHVRVAFRRRDKRIENGPPFAVYLEGEEMEQYGNFWAAFNDTEDWSWEKTQPASFGLERGRTYNVTIKLVWGSSTGWNQYGFAEEQSVTGEGFSADLDNWVELDHTTIDNVTVYGDNGFDEDEGDDYIVDKERGAIKALSSGALQQGEGCTVDYTYTFDELPIDSICLYDDRFNYNFDEGPSNSYGHLAGPEPFPDSEAFEMEPVVPVDSIVGGRVDVDTPNTTGLDKVELSNDGGQNYTLTASDGSIPNGGTSFTLEDDFANSGGSLRTRLTLQRYGSGAAENQYFVTEGTQRAIVDNIIEYADLDSGSTLLIDRTYDAQLIDILRDMADFGNYVFEFRWDDTNGKSVEWTRFGQRETTVDLSMSDYEVEKSTENIVQKAVIKGSSDYVRREMFTSNHGTAVGLANDDILAGSEVVSDGSDDTVTYERGTDYKMNYQNGEIIVQAGGSMADATTFAIEYDYKPVGVFDTGVSNPREIVKEAPALVSSLACEQTAQQIVTALGNPIDKARLTLPADEVQFNLVDTITIPGLPTINQTFQVTDIEASPGSIEVEMGRSKTLQDIIDDISRQVSDAAGQT